MRALSSGRIYKSLASLDYMKREGGRERERKEEKKGKGRREKHSFLTVHCTNLTGKPPSSSGCHQLCLAWFISSFSASHLAPQLIHTICARQQSWPRLTVCCLRLIKGICSHGEAGSNKASPTCLDADSFAHPQLYVVGSPLMEEDMYLDLFLDPYTIQVSLAATLLRTRAGVGFGDLFEMTNPP